MLLATEPSRLPWDRAAAARLSGLPAAAGVPLPRLLLRDSAHDKLHAAWLGALLPLFCYGMVEFGGVLALVSLTGIKPPHSFGRCLVSEYVTIQETKDNLNYVKDNDVPARFFLEAIAHKACAFSPGSSSSN